MWSKLQWRYFFLLLIPSLIILLLGMGLTFYSHGHAMETMRHEMETARLQTMESVGSSIDTMFRQASMIAVNLSFQVDAMQNNNASQISQFNNAIDQMLFMQANSISLFHSLIDRCYIFMFREDRVITTNSTGAGADAFFESYLRIGDLSYADFKAKYQEEFCSGRILARVPVGYMQSTHDEWLLLQTFPINPSMTPRGLIVFSLDETVINGLLQDSLLDDDSICILAGEDAALVSQGKKRHWNDALTEELKSRVRPEMNGTQYEVLSDGKTYMITGAACSFGRVLSAQPQSAVFVSLNNYNNSILLWMAGIILLDIVIAMFFTNRNVAAMNRVISSIPLEHKADGAKDVFNYMELAFMNARQKEALLSERTLEQKNALTENFIRALLRGEWQTESDILQEQYRAGISLDAPAYAVLLVHFWIKPERDETDRTMREILYREFGEGKAFLAGMSHENIACLLLADDSDLRESIEAVAGDFAECLPVTTLASDTVTFVPDVSQAYRQVRVMSRMVQNDGERLYWYRDLFQDDALYNYEYSMYSETGLRNNIAAGNEQGTLEILEDLYDKNLRSSVYSDHVLRFFAYDLYRLVNHLSTANASAGRKEALERLRNRLDQVIENPKGFDGFFEEIKNFCLRLCRQNESRKVSQGDEMLEKISRYVDEHFTDPELTVSAVADAFGISGKYLSLFYKEQTNEKISAVIEQKRIDYACRLLDTTDMTINDIALASGYALTHTFRVAFKKVQGVTPLEWKKSRSALK